MNHKILFFLFFLCLIFAQNPMESDSTDVRIIHLTFANDYGEARDRILKKIDQFPNHPKYYFFMSAMYFQQTVNVSSSKDLSEALDSMQVYGQKAIDIGEEMDEQPPDVKFYLGASYGYLGRYFAGEREWFKAYRYGKNGKDYLEEVIEDDPEFYDAYLGLGIFNYYSAKLSGVIKFLSWIVGMSGDEEKGLNYINIALEKGTLSKLDARFFMTYIYRDMEYDQSQVSNNLNYFRTTFPKNKWAINFEVRLNQRMFRYDRIKSIVEDMPDMVFDYNLSDYYLNAQEFEKIEALYERIGEQKGWRFRNIQNAMGTVYWMRNEQEKFQELMSGLDEDSWVYRNLSSLDGEYSSIDKEFYEFRRLVLFANDTVKIDTVIEKYQNDKEKYKAHRIDYLSGVYYYKLQDFPKAESFFLRSLRGNKKNYSVYRTLAVIYLQHQLSKENVELFLEYLDDYDDRFLNFLGDLIEEKYQI